MSVNYLKNTKSLSPPIEFFETSAFYGHSSILKDYAGVENSFPLPFAVQHGVMGMKPSKVDLKGGAKYIWLWSERDEKWFSERHTDKVILGGSPFLYLLELIGKNNWLKNQKLGTVVFPAHSSHSVFCDQDDRGYAKRLTSLPKSYHPITVCMYYIDVRRGRDLPYLEQDIEIVSVAIDRRDPLFLYRFIELFGSKKFAIANSLTTALFYSCALGADVFLEDHDTKFTKKGSPWFQEQLSREELLFREKVNNHFKSGVSRMCKYEFVLNELGASYIKSKDEVRGLIDEHQRDLRYCLNAGYFGWRVFRGSWRSFLKRFLAVFR